ncbi:MAG: tRNA (adenosine(37)-N6)-dimethylallyltransferase MiaA [Omnitrophica WOR_2 bacterium RIFCSPHIGHO2_02_FULL_68_15]|nr:MAG: tRNA (adenosine(37)-N6)-dimethylallyltransferase MiaA [Omnitrophica WOR_2 bacterium RIFCSPHIGHO2_02_FULL_68_15]
MNGRRPLLIVLVGPTASGKSALAVELAERLDGELLSADSMQVYRGMDIGTGKPSPDERRRAPHHGIDLVEPQIEFTVAMYRRYAVSTLQAIQGRSRVPIFIGGTGLYIRAVLDGLCPAPEAQPAYRQTLMAEASTLGPEPLHVRLQQVDPAAADRIHPHDARRIIRALEVYHVSGRPLSAWQRQTSGLAQTWDVRQVGLLPPRELLDARINVRVLAMVEAGLVEEARGLHAAGVSRTAAQALGYKELFAAFEGRWSMDEAVARIQHDTRRYARRQLTWFRRDPRITWLTPADLLQQVLPLVER